MSIILSLTVNLMCLRHSCNKIILLSHKFQDETNAGIGIKCISYFPVDT